MMNREEIIQYLERALDVAQRDRDAACEAFERAGGYGAGRIAEHYWSEARFGMGEACAYAYALELLKAL